MARMVRPSVEEEGEPELLACVVAQKHASYDRCSALHGGSAGKEWTSGMFDEGTEPLAESRTEAPSLSSSDELHGGVKAVLSPKSAEEAPVGETSALLPCHVLRPRSKKSISAGEGECHGTYGGVTALVGDADHSGVSRPFVNSLLSCLIAMLQGVEVLCNLAILYLYKDDFRLDPAVLAVAMGALKVPWTIKPLWALMSDNLPLFGYRRKSYIFIGSSLCIGALLSLGLFGYRSLWTTTVLLFLYFAGSAMCNVIGEALVVEAGRKASNEEGAANSVSVFFAFRKISFAIMSYLSGFLLTYMDKRFVFVLGTALPLAVFLTNFFLTETRAVVLPLKEQLERLLEIMKRPVVLNSTLFIFLMMSTPSAGSIMFYYMTNELKFGPELLGRMALFQSVASLLGILTYWWLFRKTNLRTLLLFSTLLVTPFCMLPVVLFLHMTVFLFLPCCFTGIRRVQRWNVKVGIPDTAFVVTDTVLMEFVGELQTMPVLVLGARLCPAGLESSIYSFLLSAYNFGLGFGSLLSAGMTAHVFLQRGELDEVHELNVSADPVAYGISSTNFENLTPMIIVCALTNLLPLGVLWLVPESTSCVLEERGHDREAESAFSSDTEAGASQISTRSASEVEKGAVGSSRRVKRSRSPSESSDSDVGIRSSLSHYHLSSGGAALNNTRNVGMSSSHFISNSSEYTIHATSITQATASRAAPECPSSTAAGGCYPATAPATAAAEGHVRQAATGVGNPDAVAAALRNSAVHRAEQAGSASGSVCHTVTSAPAAAVDVMAAVMESGGSGECTGAVPPANRNSTR